MYVFNVLVNNDVSDFTKSENFTFFQLKYWQVFFD